MKSSRRAAIASLFGAAEVLAQQKGNNAPITRKEKLTVTKLETFLVKPRWLFLKVHTNAGIVGLGEPIVEGRALTCQAAVKEIEPYLVGKDPREVVHHWQAIYRHAFYRGGPILTSALSGIDRPSGTSRARRSACRSTSCSAARRATASASTPTPARRSR